MHVQGEHAARLEELEAQIELLQNDNVDVIACISQEADKVSVLSSPLVWACGLWVGPHEQKNRKKEQGGVQMLLAQRACSKGNLRQLLCLLQPSMQCECIVCIISTSCRTYCCLTCLLIRTYHSCNGEACHLA